MSNVFKQKENIPPELNNCNIFQSRRANSVKYGTKTIPYLTPKVWSIVPETIKNSKSLESFKLKIRNWKPECPCRLCKTYLKHVRFIWPSTFFKIFFLFLSLLKVLHFCFKLVIKCLSRSQKHIQGVLTLLMRSFS